MIIFGMISSVFFILLMFYIFSILSEAKKNTKQLIMSLSALVIAVINIFLTFSDNQVITIKLSDNSVLSDPAIIAGTIAFIGVIASIYVSNKNKREEIVSEARKNWLENHRKLLTEFINTYSILGGEYHKYREDINKYIVSNSNTKNGKIELETMANKLLDETTIYDEYLKNLDEINEKNNMDKVHIHEDESITDFQRTNKFSNLELAKERAIQESERYYQVYKAEYATSNDEYNEMIKKYETELTKVLSDSGIFSMRKANFLGIEGRLLREANLKFDLLELNLSDNFENNTFIYHLKNVDYSYKNLNKTRTLLSDDEYVKYKNYFENNIKELTEYAKSYYKSEWNKVKNGRI